VERDDYDVLADGAVVGRIMKANAAPVGMTWMWTVSVRVSRGPHALCASWRRDQSWFIPTLIGAATWPAGADHEIIGLSERDAELVELFNLPTFAAKALTSS
jgi:hypothetical protein